MGALIGAVIFFEAHLCDLMEQAQDFGIGFEFLKEFFALDA